MTVQSFLFNACLDFWSNIWTLFVRAHFFSPVHTLTLDSCVNCMWFLILFIYLFLGGEILSQEIGDKFFLLFNLRQYMIQGTSKYVAHALYCDKISNELTLVAPFNWTTCNILVQFKILLLHWNLKLVGNNLLFIVSQTVNQRNLIIWDWHL